ncbi:unnamed protein product [Symbiodinium natans]|uniref:Uncharacterized protein n=1 Tax=Symbiodinium natans TaxID=878477 RepID=A0A812J6R8_9DINO|nr:unnamed protein product [Symbiodinium natans]
MLSGLMIDVVSVCLGEGSDLSVLRRNWSCIEDDGLKCVGSASQVMLGGLLLQACSMSVMSGSWKHVNLCEPAASTISPAAGPVELFSSRGGHCCRADLGR